MGLESQTLPGGGKIQVDLKAGSGGDLHREVLRERGQGTSEGAAGAAPSIPRRSGASGPYGPFTNALNTSLYVPCVWCLCWARNPMR
jgi:hypothetical protein